MTAHLWKEKTRGKSQLNPFCKQLPILWQVLPASGRAGYLQSWLWLGQPTELQSTARSLPRSRSQHQVAEWVQSQPCWSPTAAHSCREAAAQALPGLERRQRLSWVEETGRQASPQQLQDVSVLLIPRKSCSLPGSRSGRSALGSPDSPFLFRDGIIHVRREMI